MKELEEFYDYLQTYLENNNLSVPDYAKTIGIDASNITRWRQRKTVPSLDSLIKISDNVGKSIDFLLGMSDNEAFFQSETTNSFYQRIIELKKEKNVSQRKIGEDCKFSPTVFKRWKAGQQPGVVIVIELSKYFNVSIEYLIGRSDIR